jgi:pimeloyl-ACP methyl ester carboxylesterase
MSGIHRQLIPPVHHPHQPVYALDLRNHGQSPHVETMKNTAMAADVARFLRDHALDKVTLMGHSMQVSCILSMRIC